MRMNVMANSTIELVHLIHMSVYVPVDVKYPLLALRHKPRSNNRYSLATTTVWTRQLDIKSVAAVVVIGVILMVWMNPRCSCSVVFLQGSALMRVCSWCTFDVTGESCVCQTSRNNMKKKLFWCVETHIEFSLFSHFQVIGLVTPWLFRTSHSSSHTTSKLIC